MEKDKNLKKGELVKKERNELVAVLSQEPARLEFKSQKTYAVIYR